MKRVALFAKTICTTSQGILHYFREQGYDIELVIVERAARRKFSQTEIGYRKAHDAYNRITKKYGPARRMARQAWDTLLPKRVQRWITVHIASIPVMNKASVERTARKMGYRTTMVRRHSSQETRTLLEKHQIDYVLFGSSNWLIKPVVLDIPGCKIINVHPAKLPDYKGLDAMPWTILEGGEIGSTSFFLDETMDGGDILKFYPETLRPGDTIAKVQRRMTARKKEILLDTLKALEDGSITPQTQAQEGMICKPMTLEQLLQVDSKLKVLR